jgi:uncharacterized protein (DUF736 family)
MLEDTVKSNQSNEWKKRELGAFWTKESAKGKYLSGTVEVDELGVKKKIRVVMFPNQYKDSDNKPDYILYTSKDVASNDSEAESKTTGSPVTNEEIPDSL